MARAAVKAKQAQQAKGQAAKPAQRRQRRRGHSGGGNPNQQLFFMRLRRKAKFAYVLLAVLFAVTFAFLGVGSGSGSGGLDQLFNNLNIFHHSGSSVSKALAETAKHPKSPKAFRDLATAYEAKGQTSSAIGALQQLTRINPKDAKAWNELGGLQVSLAQQYATQYQSAAAAQQLAAPSQGLLPSGTLGKALGANPIEQGAAQQASGVATNLYQQATTTFGEAVSSYKQVTKLEPGSADAQFQLAQASQNAGDTTAAVAAYKAYLKLNPSSSSAAQIRQLIKQLSPKPTAPVARSGKTTSGKK
ncbi:MAG: Tetratricopeptide repeat [Actinomycetota bacterium]|jgi:tetratricopeptide (TPR) repeat protein